MNRKAATDIRRNIRVSSKVLKDYERLARQVPILDEMNKGASYGLKHPFETDILPAHPGNPKGNGEKQTNP